MMALRIIPSKMLRNSSYLQYVKVSKLCSKIDNEDSESEESSLRPKKPKKWMSFKVDRTSLFNFDHEAIVNSKKSSNDDSNASTEVFPKEKLTILGKKLQDYIFLRGPITLHDYILHTSNHFTDGYYQSHTQKIGPLGDFVTAPEISSLFGEMIALWVITAWESLGSPPKISLVELGPGNGTLMSDILETISHFPKVNDALSVHLVEMSAHMSKLQRQKLSNSHPAVNKLTVPIQWYQHVSEIPVDESIPMIFIGQEFLDAIPVHHLVKRGMIWREKLIDVDNGPSSPYHFRTVLSPNDTPATIYLVPLVEKYFLEQKLLIDYSRPPSSTVPTTDPGSNSATPSVSTPLRRPPKGGVSFEISPVTIVTLETIAKLVIKCKGAALFIDYGEDFTQADTVRGFKRHKQVNVLSEPGEVDVTSDVDFYISRRILEATGVKVLPLFKQSEFLYRMGIIDRVERILERTETTESQAEIIVAACKRLMSGDEMGKRYKTLIFTHESMQLTPLENAIE